MKTRPVRVFISYSWGEGEEYRKWVKSLAMRLREDGVDAILDAWRPEGQTIPDFMNSEVRKADKVLVLCSPTFRTKVHQTEDGEQETGVGWESGLLTGSIFSGIGGSRAKVVPVLAKGEWNESAPDFLLAFAWEDLRNPKTFEPDYERLYGRIVSGGEKPPPLGPPLLIADTPITPLRGPQSPSIKEASSELTFSEFTKQLLTKPYPSRSPIVVAVEEADNPLTEDELLPAERHLTITLAADQIDELSRLGTAALTSIDQALRAGEQVFAILGGGRGHQLFVSAKNSVNPQPIAWTGRTELLLRIHRALMLAHIGAGEGSGGLLSVGFGDHYFNPVGKGNAEWSMQRRAGQQVAAKVFSLDGEVADEPRSDLIAACSHEVAVLTASNATKKVGELVEVMKRQRNSRTRVAIGFGDNELSSVFLEESLAYLPCISIGNPGLNEGNMIQSIADSLPRLASTQAIASVVAAFRREWIRRAFAAENVAQVLDGLFWSTWSWVGKPLFASNFGEVIAPSHPHLTDLRSVASKEWYFNRREGIADCYQANTLARTHSAGGGEFHLYISGGGGTGKSCFLRFIYEQLIGRPNALAVWYRVDAPSSEWENVERRIREEVDLAVQQKLGAQSAEVLPDDFIQLSLYLSQLANNLLTSNCGVDELIIFIDQLERTFESGDEPDYQRLERVSNEVVDLLKEVKVGAGVRIFIASRKQYLPDFLQSFHAASQCGLHFNVLQRINEENERLGFIRKVLKWCQDQGLVDPTVTIDRPAAALLSGQVDGHPLEMMLALIHVFSQGLTKPITEEVLKVLRPWERLFDFDLRLAHKDKLDWYFLLAMAHTRTEIVGFEEVWWRLHLVNPTLTRRIDLLEPGGILERLWLRGHLGRSIYTRPDGADPARFLEFFHANLRDYLLRDVMSRSGETPAAWRALDRLSVAAHDWEQMLQLLDRDDIRALMEQRQFTVERTGRKNEAERDVFYLLFLRDSEKARAKLCQSAKECFVLSAVVYDESALWAFPEVFPDIAVQIDCCDRWLKRSSSYDHRVQILRYLLDHEMPEGRRFTASLAAARSDSPHAERWLEIAQILAEPLYAARYRSEVVVSLLGILVDQMDDQSAGLSELPARFQEFVVASCGANRDDLLNLLYDCADRLAGMQNPRLHKLGHELKSGNVLDKWLGQLGDNANAVNAISSWESEGRTRPRIQLVVGSSLRSVVTPDVVVRWRRVLSERLGTPLPSIDQTAGDEGEHDLELRLRGRRVAVETFFPPRCQVLMRHWEKTQTFTPPDVTSNDNEVMQEVVMWLDAGHLRQANWELPSWTADEAMLYWIELLLRQYFDYVFDYDLLNEFSREFDIRGIQLPHLREVIVNLVHEFVPSANRWPDLIELMQRGDISVHVATQTFREQLGPSICQQLIDKYCQLSVIILDEAFEKNLLNRLRSAEGGQQLALDPVEAQALAASISRHVARSLNESEVMPVVACERNLRLPLLRLIERFDARVKVLSYTELSPDLRLVDAGMVSGVTQAAAGD